MKPCRIEDTPELWGLIPEGSIFALGPGYQESEAKDNVELQYLGPKPLVYLQLNGSFFCPPFVYVSWCLFTM